MINLEKVQSFYARHKDLIAGTFWSVVIAAVLGAGLYLSRNERYPGSEVTMIPSPVVFADKAGSIGWQDPSTGQILADALGSDSSKEPDNYSYGSNYYDVSYDVGAYDSYGYYCQDKALQPATGSYETDPRLIQD